MAISKLILNGVTQMDVTNTTAVANDVAQGKNFILANGEESTGTGVIGAISITETPDIGGGTVLDIDGVDISDTTATAADVASGKYFYTAEGVRTAGTSSGGESSEPDHWIRPAEWPDLSKLDRTEEVVYISCLADEQFGYVTLNGRGTPSNKYKVAIGKIENNAFVSEWEDTFNVYMSIIWLYFGTSEGGYKVIRVTPMDNGHITAFKIGYEYEQGAYTQEIGPFSKKAVLGSWSGVLEVYGNLPYLTKEIGARVCNFLESFDITNVKPSTLNYAFAYCNKLVNLDISTWDTSEVTIFDSFVRECPLKYFKGYKNLDVSAVTTFSNAFTKISLKEFDMTNWSLDVATNMNSLFSNSNLEKVKLKNSKVACSYSSMVQGSKYLTEIDLTNFNTSQATNISYFFNGLTLLQEVDFEHLNLSSISSTSNAVQLFRNSPSIRKITVPASLSYIGDYAFNGVELCEEIHFLATTPPTLSNTNAFSNLNQRITKKIYVPYSIDHSILEAYQAATNWSTYASYIVEEDPE